MAGMNFALPGRVAGMLLAGTAFAIGAGAGGAWRQWLAQPVPVLAGAVVVLLLAAALSGWDAAAMQVARAAWLSRTPGTARWQLPFTEPGSLADGLPARLPHLLGWLLQTGAVRVSVVLLLLGLSLAALLGPLGLSIALIMLGAGVTALLLGRHRMAAVLASTVAVWVAPLLLGHARAPQFLPVLMPALLFGPCICFVLAKLSNRVAMLVLLAACLGAMVFIAST